MASCGKDRRKKNRIDGFRSSQPCEGMQRRGDEETAAGAPGGCLAEARLRQMDAVRSRGRRQRAVARDQHDQVVAACQIDHSAGKGGAPRAVA